MPLLNWIIVSKINLVIRAKQKISKNRISSRKILGLSIFFVFIAPFILTAISQTITSNNMTSAAVENVKIAYEKAVTAADNNFDHYVDSVSIEDTNLESIAHNKVSVCYIGKIHEDEFAIGDNTQVCFLRYIAGFTTNSDKQTIINTLRKNMADQIKSQDDINLYPNECVISSYSSDAIIRYIDSTSKPSEKNKYGELEYE